MITAVHLHGNRICRALAGTLFEYDEDDPDIQEDISDIMIYKMASITLDLPSDRSGNVFLESACRQTRTAASQS